LDILLTDVGVPGVSVCNSQERSTRAGPVYFSFSQQETAGSNQISRTASSLNSRVNCLLAMTHLLLHKNT
jgi:hypothetical protein